STSVLMPRRSRVGLSRALISSLDSRRGASMWARPAMATCWKSMGWPPDNGQKGTHITGFRHPPHSAGTAGAGGSQVPGSRPATCRRLPRRLVPAPPRREILVTVQRRPQRADGVGAAARGRVAGQGFVLLAHAQVVALVDQGDLVGHRDADLAALLAAGRGGGRHFHRRGAGRHVHPGATAAAEGENGEGDDGQDAHERLRALREAALWAGKAEHGKRGGLPARWPPCLPAAGCRGSGGSRDASPARSLAASAAPANEQYDGNRHLSGPRL